MKKLLLGFALLILVTTSSYSTEWCDDECAYEVKDYALLSKEVYNYTRKIGAWKRVKDFHQKYEKECAINVYGSSSLSRNDTCHTGIMIKFGLHLSVYKNNNTNQYVIAIEGTKPTDINDLITDASQLMESTDTPKQYTLARKYVKQLRYTDSKYKNATIVGHSLGGGIAQYLAVSFGMKAYTFNTAGLSSPTLDEDARVFHYDNGYTKNENILNIISSNTKDNWWNTGIDSVSSVGLLVGKKRLMYVAENGFLDLHSMDNLYYAVNYHANLFMKTELFRVNYIFNY